MDLWTPNFGRAVPRRQTEDLERTKQSVFQTKARRGHYQPYSTGVGVACKNWNWRTCGDQILAVPTSITVFTAMGPIGSLHALGQKAKGLMHLWLLPRVESLPHTIRRESMMGPNDWAPSRLATIPHLHVAMLITIPYPCNLYVFLPTPLPTQSHS